MEKSKLIVLLRTFDSTELTEFGEFIASPYFNKRTELLPFYDAIMQSAPTFKGESIAKETVFYAAFPREPFDEKQLAYSMNYLLKLAEQFMARKIYEARPLAEELDTLQGFVKKKLDKHYHFLRKKIQKSLKEDLHKDKTYWRSKYAFSVLEVDYFTSQKKRGYDPSFQRLMDNLDDLYFVDKLRYGSVMASLSSFVSTDFNIGMIDEVRNYLDQSDAVDPVILVYKYLFLSFSTNEESYFHKLLPLLNQIENEVDQDELRELYLLAINHCAKKIRTGKKEYYKITLDLFREGITNRALFEEKYLSHWTYTNVVKLAVSTKNTDFLEEFIEQHAEDLDPKHRKQAELVNKAELAFYKGQYDLVYDYVNALDMKSDYYYLLASRLLQLKTYYAEGSIEPMLSQLAAFTMFIHRRKEISNQMKKPYLNFCQMLALIMRSRPEKMEKVRQKIQETNPVTDKTWLLETMEKELA